MSLKLIALSAALVGFASMTGCDDETGTGALDAGIRTDGATRDGESLEDAGPLTVPTVISNSPITGLENVPINAFVSATFSEAMDGATLTASSFTVTGGDPVASVEGTIIYSRATVVFWPAERLASNTEFTATVTTNAQSARGAALAANHVWGFTTGSTVAPGLPVNLGTARDFVVLAKSAISTVPNSMITGHIGVSPVAATAITGFSLVADPSNVFSTSTQVIGMVFAADYAAPSPARMTTAIVDMELALTDAAGRAPDQTEFAAGSIGGMNLPAGVYKWGTGLLIASDVHFTGSATDVWILQIAQDLTVSSGARIVLDGGAVPENIFWQVSGAVDLGTTAHLEGIVLSQTSITMRTGASLNGRLLAQTAVDLDANVITQPAR